jgi:FkbH-like protein
MTDPMEGRNSILAAEDGSAKQTARSTLARFRLEADPLASFPVQAAMARRLRKAVPAIPELTPLRVAVLGGGTLGHFADAFFCWLTLEGFRAEIYLAPYGAFRQEMLDPASALYRFRPDIIWLFATARDAAALNLDCAATSDDCAAAVTAELDAWRGWWRLLRGNTTATIIQNNLEEQALRLFGQYDAAIPWSRASLIRRFNLSLSSAARDENVSLFDLNFAASEFGIRRWHDSRQWFQSKQPFSPDAFGLVAFQAAKFLGAFKGSAKKCVVLDLDNTLWGGVIGDDGLEGIRLGDGPDGEAFVAFQEYLKSLQKRGILLAVCSKNEEAAAKEPFLNHPAMRLRLEDFAIFIANWRSKPENLQEIARALNLGTDSLVLVDDNPAERELVRSALPEVATPEMPEDPAAYVDALAARHYFETASFSTEDIARTRYYAENSQREAASRAATDIAGFLKDLEMEADRGPADDFTLPRMAQLLARTNQFHPTTTRHSLTELRALAADPKGWVRWISLRDRFGDHGIVSVVVLRPVPEALIIDTWAMSCRVFSRGLEDLVFLEMIAAARKRGAHFLIGHYCPTPKNKPVADLFERLGFAFDGTENSGTRWVFEVSASIPPLSPYIRWRTPAQPESPLSMKGLYGSR